MYSDRISTTSRYNMLVADIQRNEANFNKLTLQLSSGKKVTSITDDPIAAVNIVNTSRQIGQIETFNKNTELAMEELDTLDDLMELADGYLQQAWDKAVQANNGTYAQTSLSALKTEIDEIAKTMVDLANTEFNDNFIFAGANTKLSPYDMDEYGNIIYRGTLHDNPDYIRQTEIADGVFEVINTTGDIVFGSYESYYTDPSGIKYYAKTDDAGNTEYFDKDGNKYTGAVSDLTAHEDYSGVMGALKKLSNSIQEIIDAKDAKDTDAETVASKKMFETLDMFSKAHNDILTEQTKFGGVYNRLEMTESTLETNNENLTSYLSSMQDIDIASAASKWVQAQYAYQASMQVAASTMNMSLLNYIS